MKTASLFIFHFFLLHLVSAQTAQTGIDPDRPNIVVFLVDDMGWTDTSVPFWRVKTDNNYYFRTPYMDSLASQSFLFTQAYSSSPVCSPTRTAILTGQNPMRTGITNWIPGERQEENSKYLLPVWNQQGLNPNDITLPRLLSESGYTTIHIGKAHFGLEGSPGANPENLGFNKSYAGTHIGSPVTFFPPYVKADKSRWIPDLGTYADQGMYLTDAITEVTLKVLDSLHTHDTAPFFINLAHYAVHTPIQAKDEYVDFYRQQGKTETEAQYAAMVQSMDESLGAVMRKVRELGIDDNTIFIFASDNGGHVIKAAGSPTQNDPASGGKGFWYEGGYRIPMMIRLPEASRRVIHYPTISEDLFPTILSMSQTSPPKGYVMDGENLLEIIGRGRNTSPRSTPLIWHYPHYWAGAKIRAAEHGIGPFTAIRMGNWKYIYTYDDGKSHLYDLSQDIEEKNNLAAEKPAVAKKLVDTLVDHMKAVGASRPIDRTSNQPVPYPHL